MKITPTFFRGGLLIIYIIKNKTNIMKSKYLGVSWHKKQKKWQTTFWTGISNEYIGSFKDEKKARKAYQKACNQKIIKKK